MTIAGSPYTGEMNLLRIFPTVVSYTKNFLNEIEIDLLLKMSEDGKTKKPLNDSQQEAQSDGWYSSYELFYPGGILKDLKLKSPSLYDKIENHLNIHADAVGYPEQSITNSWFNVQQKNSVLFEHLHADSILSGGLYLKVDENSSKLYFHDAHPYKQMDPEGNMTELNQKLQCVNPEVGMIVLFPSWLKHSSNNEKNQTTDRTVISFNSKNK